MPARRALGRLLDPARLTRYDGLALVVDGGTGERPGERRVRGRLDAAGLEVEALRPYAPGDDLRYVDWSALARLDALLVRRFTAEREAVVDVLVDCSASMGAPPEDDKLGAAGELAMALVYLALAGRDAVRLVLLPGDAPPRRSRVLCQRRAAALAARLLAEAVPRGALALGAALEAHARGRRGGVALVVSDLMADPAELARGVRALRARRWRVLLLHVIGPGELEPRFREGVLRDVESGARRAVAVTPEVRERYRAVLEDHLAALAALAAETRSRYARLVAGADVAAFVTTELARLGVLRRR